MSAKLKYTLVMLGAVLAALGVEVWFAFDRNESTPPITDIVVANVPREITVAFIVGLCGWLLVHFNERYKRKEDV